MKNQTHIPANDGYPTNVELMLISSFVILMTYKVFKLTIKGKISAFNFKLLLQKDLHIYDTYHWS